MPTFEEKPPGELPDEVIEAAAKDLTEYCIGFVRVETSSRRQDAVLLGSGTLVSIGSIYAVLTAHHAVSILPRSGRLGLLLSPTLQQHTIDTQGIIYLEIARGSIDSDGPDLGAIILWRIGVRRIGVNGGLVWRIGVKRIGVKRIGVRIGVKA